VNRYRYLTCESVGSGHPDKVADRISDTVLDYFLENDKNSKTGIETFVSNNIIIVGGELHSTAKINQEILEGLVEKALIEIGYADEDGKVFDLNGIDKDYKVLNLLKGQSADIRQGVELEDGDVGAGDQGMMIGYAKRETENYMPIALEMANDIMYYINESMVTLNGETSLLPDGKCQVTVVYRDNIPIHFDTIVVSNQTKKDNREVYEKELMFAVNSAIEGHSVYLHKKTEEEEKEFGKTKILINPTGSFLIGGPLGDVGLTGRKIVADQYGSYSPVGGGAFSGKDPSKVDRSGAYIARCLAVNIMEVLKCEEVSVELAYAIGIADPVSINIKVNEESWRFNELLARIEQSILDAKVCTPRNIAKRFDLTNVRYADYSAYGHFGRHAPWDEVYGDLITLIEKCK